LSICLSDILFNPSIVQKILSCFDLTQFSVDEKIRFSLAWNASVWELFYVLALPQQAFDCVKFSLCTNSVLKRSRRSISL